MVRKLESVRFNIPQTNPKTYEILKQSRFSQRRKVLGRKLSYNGRTALIAIPNGDTWFVDVLDISDFNQIGLTILEISGTTGASQIINGTEYPIQTRYFISDNKIMIERFIELIEEKDGVEELKIHEVTKAYDTQLKEIPAEIFENNELGQSDVDYYGVEEDLARLNYLDTEQLPEFERSRAMSHYNLSLTNVDAAQDAKERDAGLKRYIAEKGMASKLGGGQTTIPANGGTGFLVQQILFIEADIKYKLDMIQEATGGNNKHIMEIMVKDQDSVEMIEMHRELREYHYNQFLEKITKLVGEKPFTVTLKLSIMETKKLEQFDAVIAGEKAKAMNYGNNKNNNEEE